MTTKIEVADGETQQKTNIRLFWC